jgi:hypothetical protein
MVFYMYERLAESVVLIGSTVLSNDSILHPQFASMAPGPFDSRESIVEPPALPKTLFYMYKKLA